MAPMTMAVMPKMCHKYWKFKLDASRPIPAGPQEKGAKKYMSGAGCELWAENMLPLVMQVIAERNIQ